MAWHTSIYLRQKKETGRTNKQTDKNKNNSSFEKDKK
jgi:hypothetical protein